MLPEYLVVAATTSAVLLEDSEQAIPFHSTDAKALLCVSIIPMIMNNVLIFIRTYALLLEGFYNIAEQIVNLAILQDVDDAILQNLDSLR